MTDPTPPTPQKIDWNKTVIMPLLAALAAWLGGMQFNTPPTPTPQPNPAPAPFNQPSPTPTPLPTPAGVKIIDAKGNPD
jgi:hypothetical protein